MTERVKKYLSILELSYCSNAISFRHSEMDFLFYNKMEKEIWKAVKGFENCYEVSNLGNIKSLKRSYRKKEKLLKPFKNSDGYLIIDLRKPEIRKSISVHRLVMLTFISNPFEFPQVNHKDGNKKNNQTDNLEWCNNQYNSQHAFRTGLKTNPKGENARHVKLNNKDVIKIKEMLSENKLTQKAIGKIFGVTKGAIQSINVKRRWSEI